MRRISTSIAAMTVALGLAGPAQADEDYYGASIDDLATVTISGVDDETGWQLVDLDTGAVFGEGVLDRFASETVLLEAIRHFALHTTAPVVAYMGRDCCAVGGTTFVPTAEGHGRVGRVFVLDFPVLVADALRVFALQESDVTIQDAHGATVVERHINAGDVWIAWAILGETPYLMRSTGDLVLQLNVPNGSESVPPAGRTASCDQDVGDTFVLATHPWATGAVAVFAYEDADISLTPLGELLPQVERTVSAGTFEYVDHLGLASFLVSSTGRVSVWTGDTEGGEGISWMGDDVTQNVGDHGLVVIVHTQRHGATVFAATDGTTVDDGQGPVVLDRDGFLDLPPDQLMHITASAPVLVQTSGGNDMNDWGSFLRPVPRANGPFDCLDRQDILLEPPPDAGVPELDAGPDASGDDGGEVQDAGPDGADGSVTTPGKTKGGCSCTSANGAFTGRGEAMVFALAGFAGVARRRRRAASGRRGAGS